VLTISPLDFLNSGSDSNHNVCGPFCHFGYFSSLTALMSEFILPYDIFLYPYATNDFISANFLQP
jgi:hypothetical protein